MTKTLTTPLIDLLYTAPESMVPAVQDAMKAAFAGDWTKASKLMCFAAEAYEGEWHEKAQVAANELNEIARA